MKIRKILSLTAAFMLIFTLSAFLPKGTLTAVALDHNPCNDQDNTEVPYDGSNWLQPPEWDCPIIDPRDYTGSIMLFFDKIGLDYESARGHTQRVYVSVVGAKDPVSMMKFHIFYDTRLSVKENSKGEYVNPGRALESFTTGSKMVEDGELVFYAYSSKDVQLDTGCLFTIDLTIPENAQEGDLYPIGISYVKDDIAADTFIDSDHDEAGKLQMTYLFKKGIYNGYIKMIHFEPPPPPPEYKLGDVNGDGIIDVEDGVMVIGHINGTKSLSYDESNRADIDGNSKIDIEDTVAIISHVNGIKAIE